jgi:hypothetical protein
MSDGIGGSLKRKIKRKGIDRRWRLQWEWLLLLAANDGFENIENIAERLNEWGVAYGGLMMVIVRKVMWLESSLV